MKEIIIERRITSILLQEIPPQVEHFDAYLYAVVKRKPGKDLDVKFGKDVRIDPCVLNWRSKTIKVIIPLNINIGIESIKDLDDDWFETVEAAFLSLINNCLS